MIYIDETKIDNKTLAEMYRQLGCKVWEEYTMKYNKEWQEKAICYLNDAANYIDESMYETMKEMIRNKDKEIDVDKYVEDNNVNYELYNILSLEEMKDHVLRCLMLLKQCGKIDMIDEVKDAIKQIESEDWNGSYK